MKATRTDRRTPWTPTLLFGLCALFAGGLLGGCAPEEGSSSGDDAATEAAEESGGTVEYEPAYPEDVSAEGLSEGDAAQQEAHSHADGTAHSHGEEDDHEHDGDHDDHH